MGFGLLPDADEVFHLADAALIAPLHLFPQGAPAVEAARPGHTMEPEEVAFGAGVHIIVEGAVGFAILAGGVGAGAAAVYADAVFVGSVVVDGAPLYGIGGDVAVGLRSHVVVELEDMVEA